MLVRMIKMERTWHPTDVTDSIMRAHSVACQMVDKVNRVELGLSMILLELDRNNTCGARERVIDCLALLGHRKEDWEDI